MRYGSTVNEENNLFFEMLTFRYIDVYGISLCVGRSASVVARIAVCGVVDDEATVSLGARLGAHGDTSSRRVVVDHVLVVVPEHVLRRGRALEGIQTTH